MSANLDHLDNSRSPSFQTSGQEYTVERGELEAVDTVERPPTSTKETDQSVSTASGAAVNSASPVDTSNTEDSEMSSAEGQSVSPTQNKQLSGACGIGAKHKTKKMTQSPQQLPGPTPINWGTWRTPRTYSAQGNLRPLIPEEEEGWYPLHPNFVPTEHKVYEPIQKTFRRAKKGQEQFRNTVSHASYLSEAANMNRLPLWAYRVGPVPGYFDKEDPRWGPLFELIHTQAIERVRCIQDIMETHARELSQLYLGYRENLAYLVRAHPSMLKPLECKLMAYANTTHKQKLLDHWQSLATAPSPTAVNAEIKRRVISAAGSESPSAGGRSTNNNQQPQGAGKENQPDDRAASHPTFPKGKSKNAGKAREPEDPRPPIRMRTSLQLRRPRSWRTSVTSSVVRRTLSTL